MIYTLYLSSLIVSAAVAGALAYYLWRRRSRPGATPALCMMLTVIVCSLGYLLQFTSATLSGQILATNIQYLGIVTLPVTWFVFSLEYTGYDKWVTRRNLFLLAIVPFVTVVLAWTNGIDGLIWYGRHLETSGPFIIIAKTYGPWFWIHTSYSYLLLLSGMFFLLQRLFRPPGLYREQFIALLICVIVPVAWNMIYIFGLAPIFPVDLSPSAFVISGLAIAWGLFHFRLLDIIPVARDIVIEDMSDSVIVLDMQNRIIDINPAAQRIVGYSMREAIGQPFARVLSGQPELVERANTRMTEALLDIIIEKGETRRYYESHISPLHDQRSHLTGRLVVLHDITERKQAEKELRQSREQLRRLAEHLQSAREMERTAIAREIHDELGQDLAALQMDVSWLLKRLPKGEESLLEKVKAMSELIETTIQAVKRISTQLRPGILDDLGLVAAIEWQADEFQGRTGTRCQVSYELGDVVVGQERATAVFRILQEALTNVARHAKATSVEVSLKQKSGEIALTVSDNGRGITEEQTSSPESLGLVGMRERAASWGGEVTISAIRGKGTTLTLSIPLDKGEAR